MTLDLKAISQDPLRLLVFFLLLLIVRGLPSLLVYRRTLGTRQRAEMTFITATSLPLLIALAEIGEQDGVMLPATAAALVGAGVLSVLVYPQIAVGLHRSAPLTPADVGIATAQTATGTGAPPENPGAGPSALAERRQPVTAPTWPVGSRAMPPVRALPRRRPRDRRAGPRRPGQPGRRRRPARHHPAARRRYRPQRERQPRQG